MVTGAKLDTATVIPAAVEPNHTPPKVIGAPESPTGGETFERTGGNGTSADNGLEDGSGGVRLGQTTTGRTQAPGAVNLREAEATAARLTEAYLEPGFGLLLLGELRGKPTVQQRHILNKMNAKVRAEMIRRSPNPRGRAVYQMAPRDDLTYWARREMTGDDQAVLEAYLRNPSGELEDHDQIYLSKKGLATFEEGIFEAYRDKTDDQIAAMEARYLDAYGETVDQALTGGILKELNGAERGHWLTARLGSNNLTPAHRVALDVHLNSAAITGTRNEAVFGTLAKTVGHYDNVASAYLEIFGTSMTAMLEDELDDALTNDVNELARFDALRRGDAEEYLALTITGDELDAEDLAGTVFGVVGSGRVSAEFVRTHQGGRLVRVLAERRDPRLQAIAQLLRQGHDLRPSPSTYALQLRTVAIEIGSPEERIKAFSDLFSTMPTDPPHVRAQAAEKFEELFGQPLEAFMRAAVRELPPSGGVLGPMPAAVRRASELTDARLNRLMREWTFDRSSESLMVSFRDGVAQPSEFLAGLRAIPPGQRADYALRFDGVHGDGAFAALLDKLPKKEKKAAELEMKLGEVARGDLHKVEQIVRELIEHQRGLAAKQPAGASEGGLNAAYVALGTDLETRVSAGMMDTFGQTGVLLDEAARQLFEQLRELEHAVEDGGSISAEQQQTLNRAFTRFTGLYTEYLGEKEDVATTAGTLVAMGVALAVPGLTVAILGAHGSIAAGAVAAGVAKVGVKNSVYGADYDVLSWKAAGDFGKTVAIEMAAGEVAHAAVHLLGHGSTVAKEAVGHAYASGGLRASMEGLTRVTAELSERAAIRIGMDLTSMVGANATFGNFRMLGTSERIEAPVRPR